MTRDELQRKFNGAQALMLDRTKQLQDANAEIRSLGESNCHFQLENIQLRAHRDVLLAALADAQRRVHISRRKTRPCGCGKGLREEDECGMPLTDDASEKL